MILANIARLEHRGVVRVAGEDAAKLLQGLVTNEMDLLQQCPAIHAGLLSPQGKILFEFFVVTSDDGFLLETGREQAASLVKRLLLYKLRAKVGILDASSDHDVYVLWGGPMGSPAEGAIAYPDPRLGELGVRLIVKTADAGRVLAAVSASPATEDAWHAHRIALGVPESGRDYTLGDVFPHEVNFDQLNGVSFTKGCFVGQEVVSRMQHRSGGRKRVLPITGTASLTPGAQIKAGEAIIGTVGSVHGIRGLALMRFDRAAEAKAKGQTLEADGVPIELAQPAWATFTIAPAARTEAS